MSRLLGIDVGTSSVKTLVFDSASGQVLAATSHPSPVYHPRPEWAEFDPDELWEAVCQCVGQLWRRVPAESIDALAVASMAEAGVLLDSEHRPVYPIIAWHDPRTRAQAAWLEQQIDPFDVFQITGQQQRHILSVNKLLWLRENERERFEAGEHWSCVADYVIGRLAGEYVTDWTLASRTQLFDQATRYWSQQMLDVAGLDADLFPPAFPSGTEVGQVTNQAADETGLANGTIVCTGGHDHLCGAFAVGVLDFGQILDSSGTAQSVLTITSEWNPTRDLFESGFTHYRYVVDGRYIVQGGLPMAGGTLQWLAGLLSGGAETPDFDRLVAAAERAPAGANGVVCLPYLRGKSAPEVDPSARGAFVGLTAATTAGDLVRAALESLAYHLRELVEAMDSSLGSLEDEIIAIGGTNRGGILPQIKADVTGCRMRVPEIPEAVALGAALLAGLGVGAFETPADALASVQAGSAIYEPGLQVKRVYDRCYRYYREVYRRLPAVDGDE